MLRPIAAGLAVSVGVALLLAVGASGVAARVEITTHRWLESHLEPELTEKGGYVCTERPGAPGAWVEAYRSGWRSKRSTEALRKLQDHRATCAVGTCACRLADTSSAAGEEEEGQVTDRALLLRLVEQVATQQQQLAQQTELLQRMGAFQLGAAGEGAPAPPELRYYSRPPAATAASQNRPVGTGATSAHAPVCGSKAVAFFALA